VEDRRNPTPAGQKRPDLGAPVIADIADIGKGRTPETHAIMGLLLPIRAKKPDPGIELGCFKLNPLES